MRYSFPEFHRLQVLTAGSFQCFSVMDGTIIIRIPVRHHPGTVCGIVDRRNVFAALKCIKSGQFHRKRHLCQSHAPFESILSKAFY